MNNFKEQIASLEKEIKALKKEVKQAEKVKKASAKVVEEKVLVELSEFKNLVERPLSEAEKLPFYLKKHESQWLVYGHMPSRMKRMPNMENNHVEGYIYLHAEKSLIKKHE